MNSITGIYKITNKINNNFYIGSAVNIKIRFNTHKRTLRNNNHCNEHLQRAWCSYGESSFSFEILEQCDRNDLIAREQHYINELMPQYNILPTAGSCLGRKHSQETKNKIAQGMTGKKNCLGYKLTQDQKDVISKRNKGRPLTEETKKKLSIANTGHIIPEEVRVKISNANKGKTKSEETKKKLSLANKGRVISEEQKKLISETNKGNKYWVGRKHTEASKEKMRQSKLAYFAARGETPLKELLSEE